MKIQRYSKFLESKYEFSIYDYYDSLRNIRWSDQISEVEFSRNVEHFIGKGQWNLINGHFQKIFDVLETVDIEYINDRLLDIFDEYPYHNVKYAVRSVAYGDFERYDEEPDRRYNGMMSVSKTDTNRKLDIICHFLKNLLNDTIWIRYWSEKKPVRVSDEEKFVTSDEFSIKNFKNLSFDPKLGENWNLTKFLDFKSKFSVEKFLDMYRPSIFITIGAEKVTKISHNKIKSEFSELLPSILSDLDYEEVIWPWRQKPNNVTKEDEDFDIYDFDLKIILKMK